MTLPPRIYHTAWMVEMIEPQVMPSFLVQPYKKLYYEITGNNGTQRLVMSPFRNEKKDSLWTTHRPHSLLCLPRSLMHHFVCNLWPRLQISLLSPHHVSRKSEHRQLKLFTHPLQKKTLHTSKSTWEFRKDDCYSTGTVCTRGAAGVPTTRWLHRIQ
jgi:hypothetical protein